MFVGQLIARLLIGRGWTRVYCVLSCSSRPHWFGLLHIRYDHTLSHIVFGITGHSSALFISCPSATKTWGVFEKMRQQARKALENNGWWREHGGTFQEAFSLNTSISRLRLRLGSMLIARPMFTCTCTVYVCIDNAMCVCNYHCHFFGRFYVDPDPFWFNFGTCLPAPQKRCSTFLKLSSERPQNHKMASLVGWGTSEEGKGSGGEEGQRGTKGSGRTCQRGEDSLSGEDDENQDHQADPPNICENASFFSHVLQCGSGWYGGNPLVDHWSSFSPFNGTAAAGGGARNGGKDGRGRGELDWKTVGLS